MASPLPDEALPAAPVSSASSAVGGSDREPPGWKGWLAGLIVVGFGVLGFWMAGSRAHSLYRSLEARWCWVLVPCEVQQFAPEEYGSGRRGQKYEITIRYSYSYGGASYSSTRYSWWQGNLSSGQVEYLLNEFRACARPLCYVDPECPQESVYDTRILWLSALLGMGGGLLFGLLGLLVAWGMCAALWGWLWAQCRGSSARA